MDSVRFMSALLLSVLAIARALQTDKNLGTVSILEHPYYATIEYKGVPLCGATIIDDYYVITLRSAFSDPVDVKSLSVRVGTNKLGYRGHVHFVGNVSFFWNTGRGPMQDVAMVKVVAPFTYDPHVMWLNPNQDGVKEGQDGELPAWTDFTKPGSPLMSIPVTVLPTSTCSEMYQGSFNITSGMYCVMPKESGAPMNKVQLGDPMRYNEQLFGYATHVDDNSSLPVIFTGISDCTTFIIATLCDMGSLF